MPLSTNVGAASGRDSLGLYCDGQLLDVIGDPSTAEGDADVRRLGGWTIGGAFDAVGTAVTTRGASILRRATVLTGSTQWGLAAATQWVAASSDYLVSSVEDPKPTAGFQRVLQRAAIHVQSSGREEVTGANVLVAMFSERESHAVYYLQAQDMTRFDAVNYISHGIAKVPSETATRNVNGADEDAAADVS